MKADQVIALAVFAGMAAFALSRSSALRGHVAELLAAELDPAAEIDQAAREARAYELARRVIEKARAQ